MKIKAISYFLRGLKITLLVVLNLTVLYIVCAILFSLLPTNPAETDCFANTDTYITTNGVHLDIILPLNSLSDSLQQELDILPGTRYVALGWGDKQFYIKTPECKDLTVPVAFNALFLKSETAMHVTCYQHTYQSWRPLPLCNWQLKNLNTYIFNSFDRSEEGKFIKFDVKGYSFNDSFYAATGSFSVFRTCNIWVNKALKTIGVKTAVWSPFDFGVLCHIPDK